MKIITGLITPLILVQVGWGQTLEGRVRDTETRELLTHAEVWVSGGNDRVYTGSKGEFNIQVQDIQQKTICFNHDDYMYEEIRNINPGTILTVELRKKKISTASKRWERYVSADSCSSYRKIEVPDNPEWLVSFTESELKGDLAPDSTKVRRDPSAIIRVNGLYYVWYSRSEATPSTWWRDSVYYERAFPWDMCDIWYATSKDGLTWNEQGPAVIRGDTGNFDCRSAFTPEIFTHNNKYYIVYQALQGAYTKRAKNTVAMAVSESPDGPFVKLSEPILRPTNNGIWMDGSTDHRDVVRKGDFDSHKVHDPCLVYYKNKFYLYYKGERMGEEEFCGQREIKWGVAIADRPEGPYIKSAYNPITNTGHEVIVWQYNGGIGILQKLDGPEVGTVQYARDGVNFEIMASASNIPEAYGIYRTKSTDLSPTKGIEWGLGHKYEWEAVDGGSNYLLRYDIIKE